MDNNIEYGWQITKLKIDNSDTSIPQAVVEVFWECVGIKLGESHSYQGSSIVHPDPQDQFIPFSHLTENQVLSWVQQELITTPEYYQSILYNIELVVNRKLMVPKELEYDQLPWVKGTK